MDEKVDGVMSLEFVYVAPEELGEYWDSILPGIHRVKKHGGEWRPEDLYTAIKTQQAVLHIVYDDSYAGFTVTMQAQAWDGKVLHVWAAYSDHNLQRVHGQIMRQLKDWARNIQAKRITFHSSRKGWEKMGLELGFKPTMTIYECEV